MRLILNTFTQTVCWWDNTTNEGMKIQWRHHTVLLVFLLLFLGSRPLHANVYATDIRLNGSLQMSLLLPGTNLTVSYILNDTATAGVWVNLYSGTNLVQTLNSADGQAGTNAGLNYAVFQNGTNLADGVYSVSITAASTGYATWTNITEDTSNFFVPAPRGIAVNQDSNSPYYGRVYVANAPNQATEIQDSTVSGIFKCNADGSPADEGGFTTAGYSWGNSGFSPWKMAVGPCDRLYVDDYSGQGVVISFDPTLDPNSLVTVLSETNYPGDNVNLSGLAFGGGKTAREIFMTDYNPDGSTGIIGWQLGTNGVVSTNDTGTIIVEANVDYLSVAPYDVAIDTNNSIYTIQFLDGGESPTYDLMSFPPYYGEPETTADWAVAWHPELMRASGVAVDPSASFVALAVLGHNADLENAKGGLYLFSATNGEYLAGLDASESRPYFDVAWDNVGNLYALDGTITNASWRVYSPPGANQATTVAIPTIQAYNALLAPNLSNPVVISNHLQFTLCGQSNVTYIIQKSCDLANWTSMVTNYSTNAMRGLYVPACGAQNFYRAAAVP